MKLFKNFYLIFISMTLIFVSMLCGGCDKSEGKIDFSELQENSTINSIPEKLANGEADIAFLSTGAYISYKGAYPIELPNASVKPLNLFMGI